LTELGVYVGNNPDDVRDFESWLGDEVDLVHAFTGQANWRDFTDSAGWAARAVWSQIDKPVLWSVPLIVDGASLQEAAAGKYNDHYQAVADYLADSRPQDETIYVRTGWEFNTPYMEWAAEGREADFIGAFQEFVDTFRSVSDRFKFEWNVNVGFGGAMMDPAQAYPGDKYVDVIGLDFYWDPNGGDSKNPDAAWQWQLDRPSGLRWHQDFAAEHGKPMAFSEWGVDSANAGPYLEKVNAWFDSHDVEYQVYWNSNATFPGKLSDGSDAETGEAFTKLFSDNIWLG
jgi:beta-mannanase